MIKKILLAIALCIPMLASAQTVKLGIVDVNSIIGLMPDTKEAENKLVAAQTEAQKQYQQLQDEAQRRLDEYMAIRDKADTPQTMKERKERDVQDCQLKLQQFQENTYNDMQKMQQELMVPILNKIRAAIESVGKEGSYSMIQDANPQQIYYTGTDVTDVTGAVKAKLGVK